MINKLKIREDRVGNKDILFYWDGDQTFSIFIDNQKVEDIVRSIDPVNRGQANIACIEIYEENREKYKKIANGEEYTPIIVESVN